MNITTIICDYESHTEDICAIRYEVFVEEQNVPEELEIDGLDNEALKVEAAGEFIGLVAERLLHVVRQRPRPRFRQPSANDWWAVRRRRTGHHDEQRSHAVYMLPRESLTCCPRTVDAIVVRTALQQLCSGGKTLVRR